MRYSKKVTGAMLVPVLLLFAVSFVTGCSEGQADQALEPRSDLVVIDDMKYFGQLDREEVIYPHDLHTDALDKDGIDCYKCHLETERGYVSTRFLRLTDSAKTKAEIMDLYHDNCIGCHKSYADEGKMTGPLTCGECHQKDLEYVSVKQPMIFDYSMHYIHVRETDKLFPEEKCGKCHHEYDYDLKKLIYIKGKERHCGDCHGADDVVFASDYHVAAHLDCIKCHLDVVDRVPADATLPIRCEGCHSKVAQAEFDIVENPPRIPREQPDFLIVSAETDELDLTRLPTVPFSHVGHENFTNRCRDCHHQTLRACSECHTVLGNEEGDGVSLQRAMHEMNSQHSCIGCHELEKETQKCSGCHALMEQNIVSEHACNICHTGPLPKNLAEQKDRYDSLDDFKPEPSEMQLSFADEDIPDTVSIDMVKGEVFKNRFEPAVFPHQKIVDHLMKDIAESNLATHFHGHEDVVCQGCHHHSPIGKRPPLCESCHGEPFVQAELGKPGLKAAYHRQCIGCHEEMNIKPLQQDCEGCHKKVSTAER